MLGNLALYWRWLWDYIWLLLLSLLKHISKDSGLCLHHNCTKTSSEICLQNFPNVDAADATQEDPLPRSLTPAPFEYSDQSKNSCVCQSFPSREGIESLKTQAIQRL